MAQQRRGESGRDALRRGRRRTRLALVAAVAATAVVAAACPQGGPLLTGSGLAGGGGMGGGGAGSASLAGSWRNLTTFFDVASGDTIVSETDWTFASGGACSKLVIHTFVHAGVQDTVFQGTCTYTFSGGAVSIVFASSSVPTTFSVAFANGELLLDGFRYQRIG